MGGHSPLEQEDSGGPAVDGLPTWEEGPSHHDAPDVPDPGGGVPRVGWALEGITAATRGAQKTAFPGAIEEFPWGTLDSEQMASMTERAYGGGSDEEILKEEEPAGRELGSGLQRRKKETARAGPTVPQRMRSRNNTT
ncbi:hypothetical protein NDU88_001427 [Pleurodeles waltl]|uniref:Uncharacterized protein n=1 Tax=Pleurodeles waltl TaxID=8319 RepID=A0AAV7WMA4_PLEWA|nr:hypothetical protein NDU88_001427 [Pleurodeles waltl]